VKDLGWRFEPERFSGPAVQQAFDFCHRRRVDCREVCPLWAEVPDEAVRILVHAAFPRVIGRGKEDLSVQAVGGVPVAGELFAVVVGDGMDVVAQRVQTMHRGAVSGLGRRTGQFRDGGEQAFAFNMGELRPVVPCADDGVALPVAEPRLGRKIAGRSAMSMRGGITPRPAC